MNEEKLARKKSRCVRKGGEVHEHSNDAGFDCVYYAKEELSEKLDVDFFVSEVLEKEVALLEKELKLAKLKLRLFKRKNPRDYGRRRCLKHEGTFTESYDENGTQTGSNCSIAGEGTRH